LKYVSCLKFQLAEGMKPSPLMFNVLVQLIRFIPTWKIVPGQDLLEIAFRDPKIRQEVNDSHSLVEFI
ncbi:hypothetical protein Tco_0350473, partial [Tanacetum coccineum]